VRQRYQGPSRWEFLKDLKAEFPQHTVLGSGDLFTAEDCFRMMAETGIDGVTVARGAIGNPWIFEQARALAAGRPLPEPPSLFRQREVLLRHWSLAEQIYGSRRVGPLMRKFGIKYSACHPDYERVRPGFTKVRSFEDWQRVIDQWYAEDRQGVYPDPGIHRVQGASCGGGEENN
jgi:tRNA-dihydrouridine synthase